MTKKKTRRRSARVELWKGQRVKVARNPRGRFVSWHKVRQYRRGKTAKARWVGRQQRRELVLLQGQKRVAIYGTTRNWKGRVKRNRIEIAGSGTELYNAVVMMHDGFVPREPFTIIRAEDIDPDDFERGYWIEGPEVESIKKTKLILGYSDISTLKLDFDNKPLRTVKYWANRVCRFFKLEGFLILNSSKGSYHVVFNRTVSWTENKHIMDWVALMVEGKRLKTLPLTKYALLQGIKESSCLRIGKKKEKPVPRIVQRFGKEDKEIRNYLRFRRMMHNVAKEA